MPQQCHQQKPNDDASANTINNNNNNNPRNNQKMNSKTFFVVVGVKIYTLLLIVANFVFLMLSVFFVSQTLTTKLHHLLWLG